MRPYQAVAEMGVFTPTDMSLTSRRAWGFGNHRLHFFDKANDTNKPLLNGSTRAQNKRVLLATFQRLAPKCGSHAWTLGTRNGKQARAGVMTIILVTLV